MLLTIPFVFCLFHKLLFLVSPSIWLSLQRKWWLDLKQLIKCIVWYMINDCNSVTLGGNGTPLQYSCLENPRDGQAWWAAVYGVAQSRTLLKRLSSSSSRRQWQPAPVLLSGKSHGRRSLVGCSPWGHEVLDTTERLHFHFSLSCIGEGNGNPLQCSCLENARDRGASVHGVAQSRTRLNWVSSSSSSSKLKTNF